MDDLIRRDDAIEATWQEPTYTDPLNVLTEVRDRIEAIPSADRPQGWTPCSERLPEYRKLVLVTTRSLRVKPAYLDSIQDNGTDDWWSIPLDDADCALWNIVAWMPLPEPWRDNE